MSQVPKGYKKTELWVIPEDWRVKRLREVAKVVGRIGFRGYTKKDIVKPGRGAISISPINIIDNSLWLNDNLTFVSWEKFNESPEIQVEVGDIIFVKTGSTFGKTAYVSYLPSKVTINPQLIILKNIKVCSRFLSYYLASTLFQKYIKSILVGGAIPTLSQKQMEKINLVLPTSSEQRAIAQVLSDIDHLIESLDKLIEKKRLIKKGAMQELLTGKKRLPGFSGKWVRKKLEEVVNHFKGRGLSKEKLNVNGKYECILYGELYTTYREVIKIIRSRTNHCEGMLSKKGDILFPSSTTTTGIDLANASTILKDNVLLGGDIIVLRPKKKFDSIFLTYYLNEVKKQQIAEKTTGITIYHLYGRDLMDTEIFIPPTLEEQRAIAQILSDMDSEIESLENKKKKYEQIKKGAMQLLLTGKIRLKDYVKEDIEDVSTSK